VQNLQPKDILNKLLKKSMAKNLKMLQNGQNHG
jgi:hypothetical protein